MSNSIPPMRGKASKKDRTRPVELLVIATICAVFVGLVVFASTRNLALGGIFAVIVFIVTLVVMAMLLVAVGPTLDHKPSVDGPDGAEGHDATGGH